MAKPRKLTNQQRLNRIAESAEKLKAWLDDPEAQKVFREESRKQFLAQKWPKLLNIPGQRPVEAWPVVGDGIEGMYWGKPVPKDGLTKQDLEELNAKSQNPAA